MFKEIINFCSSVTRLKLLKFFAFTSEERTTATIASMTIGVSKKEVARDVAALARLGILTKRQNGKVTTFAFNRTHPLAESVRQFLGEATLPDDKTLARAFSGVTGVTLLVATGILANETRGAVDLLIVARRPNDAQIEKAVKKAEHLAAVPLRYAVLETKAFRERLEARDRLLRDILEFSHRIVIGRR